MAVRLFAGFFWLIMALGGRLLFARLWTIRVSYRQFLNEDTVQGELSKRGV